MCSQMTIFGVAPNRREAYRLPALIALATLMTTFPTQMVAEEHRYVLKSSITMLSVARLAALDGEVFIEDVDPAAAASDTRTLPALTYKTWESIWHVDKTGKGTTIRCSQGYLSFDPDGKKDKVFLTAQLGPGCYWITATRPRMTTRLEARVGDKTLYVDHGEAKKYVHKGVVYMISKAMLTKRGLGFDLEDPNDGR
jgi:hypothetical protein